MTLICKFRFYEFYLQTARIAKTPFERFEPQGGASYIMLAQQPKAREVRHVKYSTNQ